MLLENKHTNLYRSPSMKIGYFDQNINILDDEQTILENVQKDSKQNETLIRTVLARLGFYASAVHKEVSVLSGGERVKVSLAKIFVSDCNTLILDEPTNYLDIQALEALEELLVTYEGTILFVTHDRHFINRIASKVLAFEDGKLSLFDGDYRQFIEQEKDTERDLEEEKLAVLEMSITSVLGELSNPMISDKKKNELDQKFQKLLKEKKKIMEWNKEE